MAILGRFRHVKVKMSQIQMWTKVSAFFVERLIIIIIKENTAKNLLLFCMHALTAGCDIESNKEHSGSNRSAYLYLKCTIHWSVTWMGYNSRRPYQVPEQPVSQEQKSEAIVSRVVPELATAKRVNGYEWSNGMPTDKQHAQHGYQGWLVMVVMGTVKQKWNQ